MEHDNFFRSESMRVLNMVVVGDLFVGKTEIIKTYCSQQLERRYNKSHAIETTDKKVRSDLIVKIYDLPIELMQDLPSILRE